MSFKIFTTRNGSSSISQNSNHNQVGVLNYGIANNSETRVIPSTSSNIILTSEENSIFCDVEDCIKIIESGIYLICIEANITFMNEDYSSYSIYLTKNDEEIIYDQKHQYTFNEQVTDTVIRTLKQSDIIKLSIFHRSDSDMLLGSKPALCLFKLG